MNDLNSKIKKLRKELEQQFKQETTKNLLKKSQKLDQLYNKQLGNKSKRRDSWDEDESGDEQNSKENDS